MYAVKEIKDILRRERLSISKRRGQNFLVDAGMQKKIIASLDIKPTDTILEIGPGLGALSEDLAQQADKVFAVEKDKALAKMLQQKLCSYKNLQVIHQDILKFEVGEFTQQKVTVVGNLPYYITTPIIAYLLEQQRGKIKDIFITVQLEVGRRLVAKQKSKDYSALTILVQYFCAPEILFSVGKRAFYPQPRVDSVFVHLHLLKEPRVKINNEQEFFKIVRASFSQRRKIILNSLMQKLNKREKDEIQKVLKDAGINGLTRPEQLSIDEFALIEEAFYNRRIKLE